MSRRNPNIQAVPPANSNPNPVDEVLETCQALDVLINHLEHVQDESGAQIARMIHNRLEKAAIRLEDLDEKI